MNGPKVIHLTNDLATEQPLHELRVFRQGKKLFASLLFELRPDLDKALSPVEGENLLDERGNLIRHLPSHVYIPGPANAHILEARYVPTLPLHVEEEPLEDESGEDTGELPVVRPKKK